MATLLEADGELVAIKSLLPVGLERDAPAKPSERLSPLLVLLVGPEAVQDDAARRSEAGMGFHQLGRVDLGPSGFGLRSAGAPGWGGRRLRSRPTSDRSAVTRKPAVRWLPRRLTGPAGS